MLTVAEIESREFTCRRCRVRFSVSGLDILVRAELASLMTGGQPVTAIRMLRDVLRTTLADAKTVFEHLVILPARCHHCGAPVVPSDFVDCPACDELNIDVHSP